MTEERLKKLWLHFLWSFSLADHLGDAADALRSFAKLAGLPMPGEYASTDSDSEDPEENWIAWIKTQGVTDGIHSPEAEE
jgi:hypothetical protein